MRPDKEFTEEQLENARQMRAEGKGWNYVARELGYGGREHFIRKHIDPTYIDRHKERSRRYENSLRDPHRQPQRTFAPVEVMAERDRAYEPAERSVTQEFCGDPLPGRSALDQRMGR